MGSHTCCYSLYYRCERCNQFADDSRIDRLILGDQGWVVSLPAPCG